MRITDPVKAAAYFEARARHMLAGIPEPAASALIEREEREAARWATPPSS